MSHRLSVKMPCFLPLLANDLLYLLTKG
jgi:hypothetical protein